MQVGLVTGKKVVELVDMPTPEPVAGTAVVDISYCGICGTDLHAYQSGEPYNPAICGHEWVGHVSARAADVGHVKEGDRVAIGVATACGQCNTCQRGQSSHCEMVFAGATGMSPLASPHGGFASSIGFEASRLYHVPASLSDEAAGILEPATVAVHALRRTPVQTGDHTVVIGAGPIGLLVMQAARLSGAQSVIVVEPEPVRRDIALKLGATAALDPNDADHFEALMAHCGGFLPDVVFECAGVPATVQGAVNMVRRGGIVSLVGVASGSASIDPALWLVKEVTAIASIAFLHEDFQLAKQLVADGQIDTLTLHTSTVGLEGLAGAFDTLAEQPSEVKILVDPRI